MNINALAYNALMTNKDYLDVNNKKFTIEKSESIRSILGDNFRYVMFIDSKEVHLVVNNELRQINEKGEIINEIP